MATTTLSKPVIKFIDVGTVANGATKSGNWTADDNYTIKHIFIKADGTAAIKSTATLRIDSYVITKDEALCSTFGTAANDALLFNIVFNKSSTFFYSIKNNEGADKDFTIELVMEKGA